MSWQVKYFDKNNKGSFIQQVEWAEEHIWKDRKHESVRITKRKEGKEMRKDNGGKAYRIMLHGKEAKEAAEKLVLNYGEIERYHKVNTLTYITDNFNEAFEFVHEIKEEVENQKQPS